MSQKLQAFLAELKKLPPGERAKVLSVVKGLHAVKVGRRAGITQPPP
jgi:hypothetical protein